MLGWVYALGSVLLLTGCVSSQPMYTASGAQGHTIQCTPGWTGGIVGAVATATVVSDEMASSSTATGTVTQTCSEAEILNITTSLCEQI